MTDKKTCFVIMPFNSLKRKNGRYSQTYKKSIANAKLTPRLADDPGVDSIAKEIEDGIRAANICFADISENNPNVWYEVGFAYARKKPVVMVFDRRKRKDDKLPFDISSKKAIPYPSSRDEASMKKFRRDITKDLKEKVGTGSTVARKASSGVAGKKKRARRPVARKTSAPAIDTLFNFEMRVMEAIIRICRAKSLADEGEILRFMDRFFPVHRSGGGRDLMMVIGILERKGMIKMVGGRHGERGYGYKPTLMGEKWFDANRGRMKR